jgi:anti-anti-sigma factor
MAETGTPDMGIRYVDGTMVIQPPQKLVDRLEIVTFGDAWLEAIARDRPQHVVVSFDQVQFFGSEAIGVVIRMAKRVRAYGGDLSLCSMGKAVREIFETCRLVPTLFQVHDSAADAIASFAR